MEIIAEIEISKPNSKTHICDHSCINKKSICAKVTAFLFPHPRYRLISRVDWTL